MEKTLNQITHNIALHGRLNSSLYYVPHSLSLLVHKQKDTLKLVHCITVYFKYYSETNAILVCIQGPYCPITYVHHNKGGIYGLTRGCIQGLHNPISNNVYMLA